MCRPWGRFRNSCICDIYVSRFLTHRRLQHKHGAGFGASSLRFGPSWRPGAPTRPILNSPYPWGGGGGQEEERILLPGSETEVREVRLRVQG